MPEGGWGDGSEGPILRVHQPPGMRFATRNTKGPLQPHSEILVPGKRTSSRAAEGGIGVWKMEGGHRDK